MPIYAFDIKAPHRRHTLDLTQEGTARVTKWLKDLEQIHTGRQSKGWRAPYTFIKNLTPEAKRTLKVKKSDSEHKSVPLDRVVIGEWAARVHHVDGNPFNLRKENLSYTEGSERITRNGTPERAKKGKLKAPKLSTHSYSIQQEMHPVFIVRVNGKIVGKEFDEEAAKEALLEHL